MYDDSVGRLKVEELELDVETGPMTGEEGLPVPYVYDAGGLMVRVMISVDVDVDVDTDGMDKVEFDAVTGEASVGEVDPLFGWLEAPKE